MDFGVFIPIANNGWIVSKNSPQYMPTYELNKEITQIAEAIGFDFALSMIKWRGMGGETRYWDFALESQALMAGIAAATSKIQLYGSVQPLTINPAVFAKMAATIDEISKGRYGINIVSGWAKQEYDQLGVWPGDEFYDYRYDYAEEWVTIVKGLWANGRFTYHGKYLSVEDCYGYPQPVRGSLPIVCAGMSDRGIRFTVENADANFVTGQGYASVTELTNKAKDLARGLNKRVKTYGLYAMVYGDTDAEALALQEHFEAGTDWEAVKGWGTAAGPDKTGSTATMIKEAAKSSGFLRPSLLGSADTIARQIVDIQRNTPLDGMLFTFPDFVKGMTFFGKELMPRLRDLGLKREAWGDSLVAVA